MGRGWLELVRSCTFLKSLDLLPSERQLQSYRLGQNWVSACSDCLEEVQLIVVYPHLAISFHNVRQWMYSNFPRRVPTLVYYVPLCSSMNVEWRIDLDRSQAFDDGTLFLCFCPHPLLKFYFNDFHFNWYCVLSVRVLLDTALSVLGGQGANCFSTGRWLESHFIQQANM